MKKGFTLIEVLVVIAIIGVLAATVIGAAHSKEERAQTVAPENTVTVPAAKGHVNDYAGVLTEAVVRDMEADLVAFDHEVAVLVVNTTNGISIEEYGIKVGDAWKVGDQAEDDGVILIIATDDRKLRIEVGYGAEQYITDAKAGRILDEHVIPHLKRGQEDWNAAVIDGVGAIKKALSK